MPNLGAGVFPYIAPRSVANAQPSGATDWLEAAVLAHVLGKTAMTMPAGVYVGCFTASPGDAGGASPEITGGGYARVALGAVTIAGTGGPAEATNDAALEFPPASADWGPVGYVGVFNALTAGNLMLYVPLLDPADLATALPVAILRGDQLRIGPGQLRLRCD